MYDTIRTNTCKLGSLEKLLAFTYRTQRKTGDVNGWDLYDPRREFARQGISSKSSEKGWRITEINKDYSVREPVDIMLRDTIWPGHQR